MIKVQWKILMELIPLKILFEKELLNGLHTYKNPCFLIDYEALDANHNKMKQAFNKYWGTLKDLNINKDERRNKHKCANH